MEFLECPIAIIHVNKDKKKIIIYRASLQVNKHGVITSYSVDYHLYINKLSCK